MENTNTPQFVYVTVTVQVPLEVNPKDSFDVNVNETATNALIRLNNEFGFDNVHFSHYDTVIDK